MSVRDEVVHHQRLGHGRLLEISSARGAASATVTEMNTRLIHYWNSVVRREDIEWVQGDVDRHGEDTTMALIEQLIGTKIPVCGNHDACSAGA